MNPAGTGDLAESGGTFIWYTQEDETFDGLGYGTVKM